MLICFLKLANPLSLVIHHVSHVSVRIDCDEGSLWDDENAGSEEKAT